MYTTAADGEYQQLKEAVAKVGEVRGLVILVHPDFLLKALEEFDEEEKLDKQDIFEESPRRLLGRKLVATIITTATNELFKKHGCQFLLLKEITNEESTES